MLAALKLSSVINRSGAPFGGVFVPRLAPLALALLLQSATSLNAQDSGALPAVPTPADVKPGSINCEECPYPHPSRYLDIQVYTQDARIAYMDVPAEGAANGHTVLLLHGNNFGGFYFTRLIGALSKAGFRVIVPDQIGYGRSSKPVAPYNLNSQARNTCLILQAENGTFCQRRAQLHGPLATLLNLEWTAPTASCVICSACGYVHWFLQS